MLDMRVEDYCPDREIPCYIVQKYPIKVNENSRVRNDSFISNKQQHLLTLDFDFDKKNP